MRSFKRTLLSNTVLCCLLCSARWFYFWWCKSKRDTIQIKGFPDLLLSFIFLFCGLWTWVTFIIRSFTLDLSSSMLSTAAMEFARITSQWASEITCSLRKTGGPCVFLCFFVFLFLWLLQVLRYLFSVYSAGDDESVCTNVWKNTKCGSEVLKYFYNSATNICQPFKFYSCVGNDNRFDTPQQCQNNCVQSKWKS